MDLCFPQAPVGFFDVTPLGRIMNRFSTDVYCVDDSLPFLLNILLAQAYGLVGTIVVCCYGLPWITLLLVPLGLAYYFIQVWYYFIQVWYYFVQVWYYFIQVWYYFTQVWYYFIQVWYYFIQV